MQSAISVSAEEDVADASDFDDDGSVPAVVDVATKPAEYATLTLEAVHLLLGRDPV